MERNFITYTQQVKYNLMDYSLYISIKLIMLINQADDIRTEYKKNSPICSKAIKMDISSNVWNNFF